MDMYQALITVDPGTFIAQICNLMIQLVILKKLLLNPVKKILDERQQQAGAEIVAAQKANQDAQDMKAEYEKSLANAKAEANQIVAAAQKTATARGEAIVDEARTTAAQLREKAQDDIALEKKKAINQVKNDIGNMAVDIASKVVEREIQLTDHQTLIDEFIKNVGEAK